MVEVVYYGDNVILDIVKVYVYVYMWCDFVVFVVFFGEVLEDVGFVVK